MAAAFRIRLDIEDHGWARFAVATDDQAFETGGVSYLTDALGDLVRAALDLVEGAERCTVSFDGEPVETRLVLERLAADTVRLQVIQFARSTAFGPGQDCFSAVVGIDDLARAVLRDADRTRADVGEAAYERSWSMPFPTREVEALRAARKA